MRAHLPYAVLKRVAWNEQTTDKLSSTWHQAHFMRKHTVTGFGHSSIHTGFCLGNQRCLGNWSDESQCNGTSIQTHLRRSSERKLKQYIRLYSIKHRRHIGSNKTFATLAARVTTSAVRLGRAADSSRHCSRRNHRCSHP